MKKIYNVLVILLFFSPSYAKERFDTFKLESILTDFFLNDSLQSIDTNIIQAIKAIDNNFKSLTQYSDYKFTVIRDNYISVRKLVDKKKVVELVLSSEEDTLWKYHKYWENIGFDTINFLNYGFIKDDYDLNYPDYQYPQEVVKITPSKIQNKLKLNNIIFDTDQLDSLIFAYKKSILKKERRYLYKYLCDNLSGFEDNNGKIKPQPIDIVNITFANNGQVYVGMDIYGEHYLLQFDSKNSWNLVSRKVLWIY